VVCPAGIRCRRIPTAQNGIDLGFDQFPGDVREPVGAESVAAHIDVEVLAQHETNPPQPVEERDMLRRIARAGE